MQLFKRLSATLTAKLDQAVSQVENHEAIVGAALNDAHRALAKARMRLSRVGKDGEQLQAKLKDLQIMEVTWEARAKQVASQDERKALQCVQRRNLCRQQISQTEEALLRHHELHEKITLSVARMEQRLTQLTQQRNHMRSRHSAADAMRVINQLDADAANGLDETFDRWELLVTETEYLAGADVAVDTLDISFSKLEDEAALKADLDELLDEAYSGNRKNSEQGA